MQSAGSASSGGSRPLKERNAGQGTRMPLRERKQVREGLPLGERAPLREHGGSGNTRSSGNTAPLGERFDARGTLREHRAAQEARAAQGTLGKRAIGGALPWLADLPAWSQAPLQSPGWSRAGGLLKGRRSSVANCSLSPTARVLLTAFHLVRAAARAACSCAAHTSTRSAHSDLRQHAPGCCTTCRWRTWRGTSSSTPPLAPPGRERETGWTGWSRTELLVGLSGPLRTDPERRSCRVHGIKRRASRASRAVGMRVLHYTPRRTRFSESMSRGGLPIGRTVWSVHRGHVDVLASTSSPK